MESQNKCTMKHSIYEDCEGCGESAWDIAVHRVKELEAKLEKAKSVIVENWTDELTELRAVIKSLEDTQLKYNCTACGNKELEAENKRLREAAFYLYCNGYEKGHNDTVESSYTPPAEYPEDFPEILAEALEDTP